MRMPSHEKPLLRLPHTTLYILCLLGSWRSQILLHPFLAIFHLSLSINFSLVTLGSSCGVQGLSMSAVAFHCLPYCVLDVHTEAMHSISPYMGCGPNCPDCASSLQVLGWFPDPFLPQSFPNSTLCAYIYSISLFPHLTVFSQLLQVWQLLCLL